MAEPNCGNCKFSKANHANQLQCLRNPPQVGFFAVPSGNPDNPIAVNNASTWPIVLQGQWCGEHRPELYIAHSMPDAPPPKAS